MTRHGYHPERVEKYHRESTNWDRVFFSLVVIVSLVRIAFSPYDLEDSSDSPAFDC